MEAYGFPNALRMTIGTEEANQAAIGAITEFLAQKSPPRHG
jgi:histidinol-phosphate aminotransferase